MRNTTINLITHKDPKSPIAESYRMLRTNIQFANLDKDIKSIVVTSTGPSEGKSTTISNLAVTMASQGSRVLLIDADLRKPNVHKIFRLPNSFGMTNVLMGEKLEAVINHVEELNIDILTSGPIPPNPSELLSSNRMKDFLRDCKEKYDIVLVDAPPVGVVTDGTILSTICDGTILVVACNETNIEFAQRAKAHLEKVNANILGVVANKIKVDSGKYYHYYNYYYAED